MQHPLARLKSCPPALKGFKWQTSARFPGGRPPKKVSSTSGYGTQLYECNKCESRFIDTATYSAPAGRKEAGGERSEPRGLTLRTYTGKRPRYWPPINAFRRSTGQQTSGRIPLPSWIVLCGPQYDMPGNLSLELRLFFVAGCGSCSSRG